MLLTESSRSPPATHIGIHICNVNRLQEQAHTQRCISSKCHMPESCNVFEFTYRTTVFSKPKRTAKEGGAREKVKGGGEPEKQERFHHSASSPSVDTCSCTCGTRCLFTASVGSLRSGGEGVSLRACDPRASEYPGFPTTWPLNTNTPLQWFREQ